MKFMKQVVLVRGWEVKENYKDFYEYLENLEYLPYEFPWKRWYKSFKDLLLENYFWIIIPMPNSDFADYKAWKIMFEKIIPYLKDDVILVGHSLGWTFLTKYFEEEKTEKLFKKVKKIILISPASRDIPGDLIWSFEFDKNLKNLQKIQNKIIIFFSKDDFVVPFNHLEDYKKVLPNAKYRIFEDRGHFLQEDFDELIEEIKK